jgi:tetrapyrrole methylase family protein/MazG family protein
MKFNHLQRGITLLGIGPGDPGLLTQEALIWLNTIDTVYVRTDQTLIHAVFPPHIKIIALEKNYDNSDSIGTVTEDIVKKIITSASTPPGFTYAVPGSPYIANETCLEIISRAESAGIPLQVIDGISILEPTYKLLSIHPFQNLMLVDAESLLARKTPGFSPSVPALIAQIYSNTTASRVKSILLSIYPDQHPVSLVHKAGTKEEMIENCALAEIGESQLLGELSSLYLPPLAPYASFESFQEVIARLRAPDGCPWDREQTHNSLRPFLLEETYETLDALDRGDLSDLKEELGDLLLQIMLHAQIASENGIFNIHHVIAGISKKLIRRHPHVFSEVEVDGVGGVIKNWEAIKAEERRENERSGKNGMLDGVPIALPALLQAQEVIERAKRVGLTQWIDGGEKECLVALIAEIRQTDPDKREELLGEILFVLSAMAHQHDIDAESALRKSLTNFRDRFKKVELLALELGKTIADLSEEERNQLWLSTRNNPGSEKIND